MRKALYASAAVLLLAAVSFAADQQAPAPAVEPEAQKIVKALSDAQRAKGQIIRIVVHDTSDEIMETGEMIQYGHVRTAVVRWPDGLWMESRGDQANVTLWYDGAAFTLLDRSANEYVQVKAPATIDEAIDMVYDRYGISTPLADMLSGDIYDVLMDGVVTCRYLGTGLVGDTPCHHIAATQANIDWQAWIDQGDKPWLRKIAINYKNLPGSPRYSAVLVEAQDSAVVPGTLFVFQPPAGAKQIEPAARDKDEKPRL